MTWLSSKNPVSFRAEFLTGTSFNLNDFLVIFLVKSDDDEFLAFAPLKTSYLAHNATNIFQGFNSRLFFSTFSRIYSSVSIIVYEKSVFIPVTVPPYITQYIFPYFLLLLRCSLYVVFQRFDLKCTIIASVVLIS